jgi:hypothetical protein
MHAIRHALTPGTPVYALLRFAALGLFIAANVAVRRRSSRNDESDAATEADTPAPSNPHPRSKKKKRSRKRR